MKHLFVFACLILSSCSSKKDKTAVTIDATKLPGQGTPEQVKDSNRSEPETDCVFNDDYKGLTTEWLAKIGKTNYSWSKDLNQASIAIGSDTIYLSKGGCAHFGVLVELRLGKDEHTINDSSFWLDKALQLASEFELTHYKQMIQQKKTKQIRNSEKMIWFTVDDDNLEDNLYYNGIEVNLERKSKVISLSQYYN